MITVNAEVPECIYEDVLMLHKKLIEETPIGEEVPALESFIGYFIYKGLQKACEDSMEYTLRKLLFDTKSRRFR